MKRHDLALSVLGLLTLAIGPTALADGSTLELDVEWVPTNEGLRLQGEVRNAGPPVELMHYDDAVRIDALIGERAVEPEWRNMSRRGPIREWRELPQNAGIPALALRESDFIEGGVQEVTVTLQGREGPIQLKAAVPPLEQPDS